MAELAGSAVPVPGPLFLELASTDDLPHRLYIQVKPRDRVQFTPDPRLPPQVS